MVYKEHGMWEVLEVLRRLHRGESQVVIAAATGRDRKTIRSYASLAAELGWKVADAEPDEALALRILERLRPGPRNIEPGETERALLGQREQIQEWLFPAGSERGLKLTKVRRLLRRQGIDVPYSSLHRFAVNHCEFGKPRVTVRMAATRPGELSEIDFGRLGYLYDPETKRRRLLWALVVTLVYSRHQYVHVTLRQRIEDVLDGLEAAWEFFGGVTARVVLDNLRSAITKADRYDPIFQRTFSEYAEHRGFVIDPAVVRHPQGKPHVNDKCHTYARTFSAARPGSIPNTCSEKPFAGVSRSPVRASTARHDNFLSGSSRRRRRQHSCHSLENASIHRSGPNARSIPITTSSSARRCTRSRTNTSVRRSRCEAIVRSCASSSRVS